MILILGTQLTRLVPLIASNKKISDVSKGDLKKINIFIFLGLSIYSFYSMSAPLEVNLNPKIIGVLVVIITQIIWDNSLISPILGLLAYFILGFVK